MALAIATFRARFPEFDQLLDEGVQAALDEAEDTIDRDVMDASATVPKGDKIVGYRAAAALRKTQGDHAVGPWEAYETEAARLSHGAAAAYRVI